MSKTAKKNTMQKEVGISQKTIVEAAVFAANGLLMEEGKQFRIKEEFLKIEEIQHYKLSLLCKELGYGEKEIQTVAIPNDQASDKKRADIRDNLWASLLVNIVALGLQFSKYLADDLQNKEVPKREKKKKNEAAKNTVTDNQG